MAFLSCRGTWFSSPAPPVGLSDRDQTIFRGCDKVVMVLLNPGYSTGGGAGTGWNGWSDRRLDVTYTRKMAALLTNWAAIPGAYEIPTIELIRWVPDPTWVEPSEPVPPPEPGDPDFPWDPQAPLVEETYEVTDWKQLSDDLDGFIGPFIDNTPVPEDTEDPYTWIFDQAGVPVGETRMTATMPPNLSPEE